MRRIISSLLVSLLCPALLMAQAETEPNDNSGQANALALGTARTGDIGGAPCGSGTSNDWFALTTTQDGTLSLSTSTTAFGGSGSLRVHIHDANGNLITYFDHGAAGSPVDQTSVLACVGKGTYYFQVARLSSDCYTYAFTVTLAAAVFSDDTEDNDNAGQAFTNGALAHNTFAQGHVNFSYTGDNDDWYFITTPAEGSATFTTIAESEGGGAVRTHLYDGSGNLITYYDGSSGASHDDDTTTYTHDCLGQGNYYLRVASIGGCGHSYELKYQTAGAVYANDVEPNNSTAQAFSNGALAHNTFTEGHINFSHYGDNSDWYFIQTPAEGTIRLTAIAERVPVANGNIRVHLYDGSGNLITYWDPVAGGSNAPVTTVVEYDCAGQGNYYLQVVGINGCGISYRLKYETLPAVYGTDVEPNNSASQAFANGALAHNTFTDGHINFINYGDNSDWYFIQTPADGAINITMIAERVPVANGNIRVHLYDGNGNLITYWDTVVGGSNAPVTTVVQYDCAGQGNYYLQLISTNGCGISYRMKYELAPAVFGNDAEPNGSFAQALVLNPDSSSVSGHINFNHYGENIDDYRVVLPGAGNIAFNLESENAAGGGLRVHLYDANGNLITYSDHTAGAAHTPVSSSVSFTGLGAGTYYLRLQSISGCGLSYRLNCNDVDNDGTCNYFDLCPGGPEPGTPCDDGSACTTNDVITGGCACAGTAVTCNDNDPCTIDTCNPVSGCVFTPSPDTDNDGTCDLTDGCPSDPNKIAPGICGCGVSDVDTDSDGTADCNDGCPNDPNKVAPGACGCGVADTDSDSDGTPDCNDACPLLANLVNGNPCDDGNPNTINDVVTNCLCAGTLLGNDCEGVPGGPAQPGTACDDNDDCTTNDVYDTNCQCAGTFADADNDGTCDADDLCPGGPEPGTACDDLDVCTTGDVIGTNCLCAGTFADADNDGTCDADDLCPGGPEPGTACNDLDANTTGDVIGTNCLCAGVNVNCTEDLVMSIALDAFGSQTTWEITDALTSTVVASGGPYSDGTPGAIVSTNICLPAACYNLVVSDAMGDGIAAGGYVLTDDLGRRIIDASGDFGPESSVTISGGDFCVPLGPTFVKPNWCDRTDLVPSSFIYCQGVAGASGYQFWFFDPHGSYSRRILRPATDCRLSNLQTNPAPFGLPLNVCVRPLVNGNYLPFGKVCRIMVNNPGGNFRDLSSFDTDGAHLSLYPNPNRDEVLNLKIEGLSEEAATAQVEIFDAMGKRIASEQLNVAAGALNHAMTLGNGMEAGLYFVHVVVDGQTFTERLVRQ
ncbi:MAG: T9SS type A sorting domain-containing protein [Flavobacteriales bacterium]|nr:MAG: T9SS type A sorting domain-containing protein [Flavobacteriales bacterium]